MTAVSHQVVTVRDAVLAREDVGRLRPDRDGEPSRLEESQHVVDMDCLADGVGPVLDLNMDLASLDFLVDAGDVVEVPLPVFGATGPMGGVADIVEHSAAADPSAAFGDGIAVADGLVGAARRPLRHRRPPRSPRSLLAAGVK